MVPGAGYQNLSASMNVVEKGTLNTAASVHLRDAMKELQTSHGMKHDMSFRVKNAARASNLYIKNVEFSEQGTETDGVKHQGPIAVTNSIDGVSKLAVQKLPVSIASILSDGF